MHTYSYASNWWVKNFHKVKLRSENKLHEFILFWSIYCYLSSTCPLFLKLSIHEFEKPTFDGKFLIVGNNLKNKAIEDRSCAYFQNSCSSSYLNFLKYRLFNFIVIRKLSFIQFVKCDWLVRNFFSRIFIQFFSFNVGVLYILKVFPGIQNFYFYVSWILPSIGPQWILKDDKCCCIIHESR